MNPRDARVVPRPRHLSLTLEQEPGSTVSIWFDRGLGHWRVRKSASWQRGLPMDDKFVHRAPPPAHAQKLGKLRIYIIGREYKTVVFVTPSQSS